MFKKIESSKATKGTFIGIIVKLLNIFIFIFIQSFLVKRIDVAEFSLLPVVNSFVSIFYISRFVITGGIVRYVGDAYYRKDLDDLNKRISSYFIVIQVGSVLVFLLLLLIIQKIDSLIVIEKEYITSARKVFFMLILSFIIQLYISPFESILMIVQEYVLLNILDFFYTFVRILLLFILFEYIEISIVTYILSTFISDLLFALIKIVLCRIKFPQAKIRYKDVRKNYIIEQLKLGLWLSLSRISVTIYRNIDPIILNRFSDAQEVSTFYFGSIIRKQVDKLIPAFNSPLQTMLTAYNAENAKERFFVTFISFSKYFSWFYLCIAIPAILLRHDFLRLYVENIFPKASFVIVLLMLEQLSSLGIIFYPSLSQVKLKVRKYTFLSIIHQVINLSLTLLFVGYFKMGAIGSAFATFLSNFIIGPFLFYPEVIKLLEINFKTIVVKTIIPGILPAIIPIILYLVFIKGFMITNWFTFLLFAILIDLSFLVACYFFMNVEEKEFIKGHIMRFISKILSIDKI